MKRNTIGIVALLLALLLALCGCGSGGASESYDSGAAGDDYNYAPELDYSYDYADGSAYNTSGEPSAGTSAGAVLSGEEIAAGLEGRKVIYNANLSIKTRAFDESYAALQAAVSKNGGYIQSSEATGGYYYGNSYYESTLRCTVRVPSESFNQFISAADTIGEVTESSYSTQDVTSTYVDIEARVSALETQEQRLLELLEEAGSLADILTLESKLADVRYEIESLTAQLNSYDDLVSYSTISIYLYEEVEITPVAKEGFWSRAWYALRDSFNIVLRVFDGIAMFLIYAWFWILLAVVVWLLLRKRLRARRERKKQQARERYELQVRQQAEANAQAQLRYGYAPPQQPTAPAAPTPPTQQPTAPVAPTPPTQQPTAPTAPQPQAPAQKAAEPKKPRRPKPGLKKD